MMADSRITLVAACTMSSIAAIVVAEHDGDYHKKRLARRYCVKASYATLSGIDGEASCIVVVDRARIVCSAVSCRVPCSARRLAYLFALICSRTSIGYTASIWMATAKATINERHAWTQ